MRVLIIKTSSMGDVIHTLPAITDAAKAIPGISFDWVVEENFSEIPLWNPAVKNVIPVAIRRWRKNLTAKKTWTEWALFRQQLAAHPYDFIIDAQGLLKSAFLSYFVKGKKYGFDRGSAREALAALFYQHSYSVERNQHAITRLRQLFSQILNYPLQDSIPDYGVDRTRFSEPVLPLPYLVFLHGTTWTTKHWPEAYWMELVTLAAAHSFQVKLLWGNDAEKARVERIAATGSNVEILPRLNLAGIVKVLANAKGVVGVDTGLSHLAAALNVPTVSLYGPTNPSLTGALGKNQVHLSTPFACSPCMQRECTYKPSSSSPSPLNPPCFTTLPPSVVWNELSTLL
jgi:heptosyltransferase I